MTDSNRKRFLDYATEAMPNEACALLTISVGREVLVLCKNEAEDPRESFMIGPYAFRQALSQGGDISGIVHSHVFKCAKPSESDLVSCEATNLPWHIVSVPTGKWCDFKPSQYKAPLIGRNFFHGVLDCYSLIQDYYREHLGISLMDFERGIDWWAKGENLYLDHFSEAGFQSVTEQPEEHDVLLMQICSKVPNHGAILVGKNQILHHLQNRLSCREVYGGYYQKHTVKILRHILREKC